MESCVRTARESRQDEVNTVMSSQLLYSNQDVPKEPDGALNFSNCSLQGKGGQSLEGVVAKEGEEGTEKNKDSQSII